MTLPINVLTPDFAVAPQLDPAAMAEAAAAGFRSVINNRPDGEGGPEQPLSTTIGAAAAAAGLQYAHLPVQGGYQSPEEIAAFRELLATLPGPVLAFCRSGARCTKLFVAATQG